MLFSYVVLATESSLLFRLNTGDIFLCRWLLFTFSVAI